MKNIVLGPGSTLDTIDACDGNRRQNQKDAREASKLESDQTTVLPVYTFKREGAPK